jgi:hypothetical protein
VDEIRAEVIESGQQPILACTSWSLPGELGFYCEGHPPVYSVGLPFGDRRSQYDLWRPNPIDDVGAFAGRTFIVVGFYDSEALRQAFAKVEAPRVVIHYEDGRPVAQWVVTVARGYKGFAPTSDGPSY